jgi:cell division protein FtsQ
MARPEHDEWHDGPLRESLQTDGEEPEQEPSSSRPGKMRRIFGATPVIMTVVMMLLVAVAVLSWYATQWKQRVTVNRVVVSGTSLLASSGIEKRLKAFSGKNLEEVRIDDVRRELAEEPWIRSMRISKELNGILRVRIEERRPAALLADDGRRAIIDTEGYLLPDEGVSGRFRRLVPVYGAGSAGAEGGVPRLKTSDRQLLAALLQAFQGSTYAGMMVSGIHLERDNRTWFSAAASPIRFVVGNDGNFKEKLKKFEIFWQKVVAKKGIDCYESVDLRFRDRAFASVPESEAEPALPAAVPAAVAPAGSQIPDEHH